MTTLNTIIRDMNQFTTDHMQLNTFYSGDSYDFQSKTNIYPALLAVKGPAIVQQGSMSVSFTIFIIDICNKDMSNVDEIHSDTLQIFGDLISYFKDRDEDENNPYGMVDTIVQPEPVIGEYDDNIAGWSAEFSLEFPFAASSCNLPIKK